MTTLFHYYMNQKPYIVRLYLCCVVMKIMTKTCCLDCVTPQEICGDINCRTEPSVSFCKQKPNERNEDAEYPKTNKDLCYGYCDKFTLKRRKESRSNQETIKVNQK